MRHETFTIPQNKQEHRHHSQDCVVIGYDYDALDWFAQDLAGRHLCGLSNMSLVVEIFNHVVALGGSMLKD